MHAYLKEQPLSSIAEHSEWQTMLTKKRAASPGPNQVAIWEEYNKGLIERHDRERHAMSELFGADVDHVLTEFTRLGLISDHDAEFLRYNLRVRDGWIKHPSNRVASRRL